MLPLRLVVSWLFLSAVLRRLVLAPAKHDIDAPQWIGHKINTFFPHANGSFHEMLEYLSRTPDAMNVFTYVFTYSELVLGVLLLLDVFSRLTGLFLISLAVGLMHTAGWLGPTCLDEWQIASLLLVIGVVMSLYGSGGYSLDSLLTRKYEKLAKNRYWQWVTQVDVFFKMKHFSKIAQACTVLTVLYVMGTNQLLHGGVWGKLHNYSTKPNIVISDVVVSSDDLTFSAFRDQGPETYGAFIVAIRLKDATGEVIQTVDASTGDGWGSVQVKNVYINQVITNENSIVFPLGGKATLSIPLTENIVSKVRGGVLELEDVSGKVFRYQMNSNHSENHH